MEFRDLYSKDRVFSGKTIIKEDKVPPNLYYLVVFAIIEDNGKYLIQKRTIDKGGQWAFTAGHPLQGEDSITGLIREIKEELNLDSENEEINLLKTVIDDVHIIDIYHIKMNLDQACKYVNLKQSRFRGLVRDGTIPKGRKEAGDSKLYWYKDELDIAIRQSQHRLTR